MKKINLINLREEVLNQFKAMGCKMVAYDYDESSIDYVIASKEQAQAVKQFILNNCVKSIKSQLEWRSVNERDFEKIVQWSGMYHTYIGTFRHSVHIRVPSGI